MALNDAENPAGLGAFKGLAPTLMDREDEIEDLEDVERKTEDVSERLDRLENALMTLPAAPLGLSRHAATTSNLFSGKFNFSVMKTCIFYVHNM